MQGKLSALAQVCVTMLAWMALFHLNTWFFSFFDWTKVICWIFLPAAVRLLCVLLFNWRGALGLWLGTFATNEPVFGADLHESLVVATISATAPLAAVYISMRLLKVSLALRGLSTTQLIVFAIVGALCNVLPHNLYFWSVGMTLLPFSGVIPMFVGDIAGTVIVLYTLRGALVAAERFVRLPTR